jgi:predicted outer membrane repeat protein
MNKRLFFLSLAVLAGGTLALLWLAHGAPAYATPAATRLVNCTTGTDSGDCTGSPCHTIQYAINKSSYGDRIEVAAGTCNEHITMKNGVSVYGQGWANTIINGDYTGSSAVVYIPSSVVASTVLSGVQITGGGTGDPNTSLNGGGMSVYGNASIINTWVYSCTGYYGGGVYVNGGTPTFDNVPVHLSRALYGGAFYLTGGATVTMLGNPFSPLVTHGTLFLNSASNTGGAIYMGDVSATLSGLRIYWNSAGSSGGGIYIEQAPDPITILLNDISGNQAHSNGGGIAAVEAANLQMGLNFVGNPYNYLGAFWVGGNTAQMGDGGGAHLDKCAGLLLLNQFNDNSATNHLGGGASVWFASPNLTLKNNWFIDNDSKGGGGLYLQTGADPLVDGNAIVNNTGNTGGGIFMYQAGAARIVNNIIAGNSSGGLGGGVQIYQSPAELINNTIENNTGDGVIFSQAEGVVIANNIIGNNSGDGIERDSSDTTVFTADYNNVYNNSGNYLNISMGAHDSSVNPQFVGSGDMFAYYHIQPTSPVATTGSAAWAPTRDCDGDIRVFGGSVSRGADEIPVTEYRTYLPLTTRNY